MTVVIGEFENLGEAPPAGGAVGPGAQPADQRSERRRVRMARARALRMARN